MSLGVWAEQMTDDAIREALPALAAARVDLALMLPAERVHDPEFARLTRRAADAGVRVRAWPLLPRELGYWISESNACQAADLVRDVVAWRGRRGGPALEALSFDLEPDFEYSESLRLAARVRLDRVLRLMASHVEPRRFQSARDELARAVERVRAQGLSAHAVTYPLVLDQPEGSTLLEDALDIPVSGIDWDEVSFMVYQTPFAQLSGHWLGPDLVRSYAASAVARFGPRAGLDLGIVGDAGVGVDPGSRYPSPEALGADVAAAERAGVLRSRLRVYGLAGVVASGGVERWLTGAARAVPTEPSARRSVAGLRALVGALEVALRVARRA